MIFALRCDWPEIITNATATKREHRQQTKHNQQKHAATRRDEGDELNEWDECYPNPEFRILNSEPYLFAVHFLLFSLQSSLPLLSIRPVLFAP